MKTKILLVLLMIVISGCYRPNWYRANTTHAELKADSYWCKTQTKVGAPRSEIIEQYEVCMKSKGYQLGGGQVEVGVKSPTKTIEQRVGQTGVEENGVDKNTKVYVTLQRADRGGMGLMPAHRYFHKSNNCKHLLTVSTKEVTADEAIADGKTMCPDCFR
jgi:hypothetical protein